MKNNILKAAGLVLALGCATSVFSGCSLLVKDPAPADVLPSKEEIAGSGEVAASDNTEVQPPQTEDTATDNKQDNERIVLYSPDGRTAKVTRDEFTTYLKNGWFTAPADIRETGFYLAAPATDDEILAFATTYADEITQHMFGFSVGMHFDSDWDNPIKGPEHEFGYDDEYLWCEITDSRINSLDDLREFWHMTFPSSFPPGRYMDNYMEKGGKVYVAQAVGLGGGLWSSYVFDSISHVSDTEVILTGNSYLDYDGDGKVTYGGEDDETEYMEEATLTMVLEDGKWKCILDY